MGECGPTQEIPVILQTGGRNILDTYHTATEKKKKWFQNLPFPNRSQHVTPDVVVFQKAEMDAFLEMLRHGAGQQNPATSGPMAF